MNCELIIIDRSDPNYYQVCEILDNNIVEENLKLNGGTLNYKGIVYQSHFIILATLGDEIIGFNAVLDNGFSYYIAQIAVKKKYQQQGVGLLMMGKVIDMAEESNKHVSAHVMDYNEYSKKMFNTLGFNKLGENRGNGFYEFIPKQKEIGSI